MTGRRVVVVGAALAGLRCAEALREFGFDGELVLVGAEPHPPYDRPPLSKQVLLGVRAPAEPLPIAGDLAARCLLSTPATALDLDGGRPTVHLADATALPADGVVITTGAGPRSWSGPGAHLSGVLTLRTADDARRLRDHLDTGARVLVVGGGFIGAEVAAAARRRGNPVVLVERESVLLSRPLGALAGAAVTRRLAAAGVDVRTDTTVHTLTGDPAGRLTGATLDDGHRLPADVAVVGLGTHADTDWLADSGLQLADGVVCDAACRARTVTGRPVPVVAAGDVARWPDPLRAGALTAVRHWSNATEQARAAARTLLAVLTGDTNPPVYRHVPSFWSDLVAPGCEIRLRSVGHTADADDTAVLDGDLDTGSALLGYLRAGRLVGALSVNRPRQLAALRATLAGTRPDALRVATRP